MGAALVTDFGTTTQRFVPLAPGRWHQTVSERNQRLIGALVGAAVAETLVASDADGWPDGQLSSTKAAAYGPATELTVRLCARVMEAGGHEGELPLAADELETADGALEAVTLAVTLTSLRFADHHVEGVLRRWLAGMSASASQTDAAIHFSRQLRSRLGAPFAAPGAAVDARASPSVRGRFTDDLQQALRCSRARGAAIWAGALAGASCSIGGIPSGWVNRLRSSDPTGGFRALRDQLWSFAYSLDYLTGHRRGPSEVLPGLYVANLDAALVSSPQHVLLSLCRLEAPPHHADWREFYLDDSSEPGSNIAIDDVLDDLFDTAEWYLAHGRSVLVHCHSGASRTGLALRGWLMWRAGLAEHDATSAAVQLWPHVHTANAAFTTALRARAWPGRAHSLPGHDDIGGQLLRRLGLAGGV